MLSSTDLYLFDTLGFLRVKGLFRAEATSLRSALAKLPTTPCAFSNTVRYEGLTGQDPAFHKVAEDERIRDRVQNVINQPIRLVESYSFVRTGPSVLYLHNGLSEKLEYEGISATRNLGLSHTYHDGRLYCMFVKALVYLTEIADREDGPFCYIQGSHKANFPLISQLSSNGDYVPLVDTDFPSLETVYVEPGDVIFLNEALMHGTVRKTNDKERGFLAFTYAPTFVSDYQELNRRKEDIYSLGHYEAAEEEIAVEAGYPI